jgi:hypothetical protein
MRAALAIVALLSSSLGLSFSTADAQASPRGTYSDWTQAQSPTAGFYNLDISVYPGNEPDVSHHGVFYAHQFGILQGSGGYIGLQKDRNGKRAIFSIWNALEAQGPGAGRSCRTYPPPCAGTFGGEGEGYQTMVPYTWQPGHYYRYRVWTLSSDARGTWWGGWIIDETTRTETLIGTIRVPAAWQGLDRLSFTWVEYYGANAKTCGEFGYSLVYFDHPTANAGESVAGNPSNHLGPGTCPSQITMFGNWAKHEMGLSPAR